MRYSKRSGVKSWSIERGADIQTEQELQTFYSWAAAVPVCSL